MMSKVTTTESRVLVVKRHKQKVAELKKGKLLRENEIQIYEQLIELRECIVQDPNASRLKKLKTEWQLMGLKEDVRRWKETVGDIDKQLSEESTT